MNIIVIGCGRVGAELAYRLFDRGHIVTVVDDSEQRFTNLNPNFRGRTILGNPLNEDVLYRAGIEQADGLAAVTNSDTLNAVIGHVARDGFEIANVVVRNYDPRRRTLVETFGLQTVSSSSWGAQRVEELLYHAEMRTVFSAGNGEVEVYEFAIPDAWSDRPIRELVSNGECSLVALTRAGQAALPSPDTILKEGDILVVSATLSGIEGIRHRLSTPQEA